MAIGYSSEETRRMLAKQKAEAEKQETEESEE